MIRALIRRVARNERGAAIIELALIAPIMALTMVGIVDLSNGFSRKLALEQGAQRAIEKIMQTTGDDTVEGTLTTEAVCQVNGMNANGTCKTSPITASDVTVTWRLECRDSMNNVVGTQTSSDPVAFDNLVCASSTQKEGRYVEILVNDKYVPMFPIHFSGLNADNTYHLSAKAGMRTQ
jgi:Flp pilus assembly protein TadG